MHGERPTRVVLTQNAASFEFFIPGMEVNGELKLVAKQRPQAKVITPKGGRPFPQFYTPKETADWEAHVGAQALVRLRAAEVQGDRDFTLPIRDCRILASFRFNLRKPKSYPKNVVHHVTKPDVDNLAKAILDALVLGQVLGDDNCVTDLSIMKRYADFEHPIGVEVDLVCISL